MKKRVDEELMQLQGILIYRGYRLIRRLECLFGDDDMTHLIKQQMKKVNASDNSHNGLVFKQNGIVSVYKSRS